jgi:hypothetical protein
MHSAFRRARSSARSSARSIAARSIATRVHFSTGSFQCSGGWFSVPCGDHDARAVAHSRHHQPVKRSSMMSSRGEPQVSQGRLGGRLSVCSTARGSGSVINGVYGGVSTRSRSDLLDQQRHSGSRHGREATYSTNRGTQGLDTVAERPTRPTEVAGSRKPIPAGCRCASSTRAAVPSNSRAQWRAPHRGAAPPGIRDRAPS